MTIEHRIVVGWGDVEGVVFECSTTGCGARVVVGRDSDLEKTDLLEKCPNGHPWGSNQLSINRHFQILKQHMRDGRGFRILLQFDDPLPSSADRHQLKKPGPS